MHVRRGGDVTTDVISSASPLSRSRSLCVFFLKLLVECSVGSSFEHKLERLTRSEIQSNPTQYLEVHRWNNPSSMAISLSATRRDVTSLPSTRLRFLSPEFRRLPSVLMLMRGAAAFAKMRPTFPKCQSRMTRVCIGKNPGWFALARRKFPPSTKAIPTKLILRIKLNSDISVDKYKV